MLQGKVKVDEQEMMEFKEAKEALSWSHSDGLQSLPEIFTIGGNKKCSPHPMQ